MDWHISENDRLSIRYDMSRYTGINQQTIGTNIAEEHSGNSEVNTDNLAAVYTCSIGPDMAYDGRRNRVQDEQPGYANTHVELHLRQAFPGSGTTFPISNPDVKERVFFLQNAWRVTDRLTVDYGVRYDYFSDGQSDDNNPNSMLASAGLETGRIATADARLSKDIPLLSDRFRLRLIGEAFNITNRANFNTLQTTQYSYSGGFFRPTTNYMLPQTVFDQRIIQLAVKIVF